LNIDFSHFKLGTSHEQYKKFMKIYKDFNIIDFAVPIIDLFAPVKYSPAKRYNNRDFFTFLLDFCSRSVSWTSYKGFEGHPIRGKYLGDIHRRYCKKGVYKAIYRQILNLYLSKGKEQKFYIHCLI
jgi:hypothetical protein